MCACVCEREKNFLNKKMKFLMFLPGLTGVKKKKRKKKGGGGELVTVALSHCQVGR